jgi:EAL domain-containing protein (putative c-di-GMP-specific phosphodiesterase class I)/GGDEF domain-containing protein
LVQKSIEPLVFPPRQISQLLNHVANIPENIQAQFGQTIAALNSLLSDPTQAEHDIEELSGWILQLRALINQTKEHTKSQPPTLYNQGFQVAFYDLTQTADQAAFTTVLATNDFNLIWHFDADHFDPDQEIDFFVLRSNQLTTIKPFIQQLKRKHPNIPITVLSEGTTSEKLGILKMGIQAILPFKSNPIDLLSHLFQHRDRSQFCRLLMIGDCSYQAMKNDTIHITQWPEIPESLNELRSIYPDVCLIASNIQSTTGFELAQLIHAEPKFTMLPIYIANNGDTKNQSLAPYVHILHSDNPDEVIPLFLQSAAQYRTMSQRAIFYKRIDPTTGLLRPKYFSHQFHDFVHHAQGKLNATIMISLESYSFLLQAIGINRIESLHSQIALRVQGLLNNNEFACRYTDRQFCIGLVNTEFDRIHQLAGLLLEAVRNKPYQIAHHMINVAAHVGLSAVEKEASEIAIANALQISTQAIHKDIDILSHGSLVHLEKLEKIDDLWGKRIKQGFEKDKFFLVFHPIISLLGDDLPRYETLLRLREGMDIFPPIQFLDALAAQDKMTEIDRLVIQKSIKKITDTQDIVQLFIKISLPSMRDSTFIPWLEETLKASNINPTALIFELSEKSVFDDFERTKKFASGLRLLQVGLSIEHFGVHQDSLELLSNCPIEFIKLDKSLTYGIASSPEHQILVKKITRYAAENHSRILASYVESTKSLSLLLTLGVSYIQGNFLQQPTEALDYDFNYDL